MNLLGLPNELLCLIILAIVPDNIVPFHQSCKRVHLLSKSLVNDYKRRSSWAAAETKTKTKRIVFKDLIDCIHDPHLLQYVRSATFIPTEVTEEEYENFRKHADTPKSMSILRNHAITLDRYPRHAIWDIYRRLENAKPWDNGCLGSFFFLFALLMPNLRRLWIPDPARDEEGRCNNPWVAVAHEILDGNRCLFPNLQSVILTYRVTLYEIAPVLVLPSLKSLRVLHVYHENIVHRHYGFHKSTVETFVCSSINVASESFARFLEPLTSLRTLHWHRKSESGLASWRPAAFLALLAESHPDITKLVLTIPDVRPPRISVPIQNFKSLHNLTCLEISIKIITVSEHEPFQLANILPPCIQAVCLHHVDRRSLNPLFRGLATSRSEFPELRQVDLALMERGMEPRIASIARELKGVHINLTVNGKDARIY